MTDKAKRIRAVWLLAVLLTAAVAMLVCMHPALARAEGETTSPATTATANNGVTMTISQTGKVIRAPQDWLCFDVTFSGEDTALTKAGLSVNAEGRDVRSGLSLSDADAAKAEGANYADHVYLDVIENNELRSVQLTQLFGKGIDWMDIYHVGCAGSKDAPGTHGSFLVICINGEDPLTTVRGVTFKAGFQYFTTKTEVGQNGKAVEIRYPVATLKQDVHLWTKAEGYGTKDAWDYETQWQASEPVFEVTNAPTTVPQGDYIDFSGMTVTVSNNGGETQTIALDKCIVVSDYNYRTAAVGDTHHITVSYHGRRESFDVQVVAATRTLDSITLNTPTLTVRRYESVDLSGIELTLHFTDSSTMKVNFANDMISEEFDTFGAKKSDLSTIASQTRTISYTHAGTTKTADLALTVTAPDTTRGLFVQTDTQASVYNNQGYLGIYMQGVGFEGFNEAKKLETLDQFSGARVGDYMEIENNGETKTLTEWIAAGKLRSLGKWDKSRIALCANTIDSKGTVTVNEEQAKWLQTISKITFLAGYQWVQANAEYWKKATVNTTGYYTMENAVVKEDISIFLAEKHLNAQGEAVATDGTVGWRGTWARCVDSISATYSGPELTLNDTIDKAHVTVTGTYGGKTWTIESAAFTLTCDTTQVSSAATVTVDYWGVKQTTFTVVVQNKELTGIEVSRAPTVTTYELGDYEYSWEGLEVTAVYTIAGEGTTKTEKTVLDADAMSNVTIARPNVFVKGTQDIEVTYKGKVATFSIEIAYDGSYGMTANWSIEAPFNGEMNSRNVCVRVDLFGKNSATIPDKACQVAGNDSGKTLGGLHDQVKAQINQPDFAQYILINEDKTAQYWIEQGAIDWIGWYGRRLVIALKPDTSKGKLCFGTDDPHWKDGDASLTLIRTLRLKAGLQYYSAGVDCWPAKSEAAIATIRREKFMVLTQDVLLYNDNGNDWYRTLKKDEDGETTLASSLTIKANPAKTAYTVGEEFSSAGMVLHAVYEDGAEEDVQVTAGMVGNITFAEAGEQTVTVFYSDSTIELKVTVSPAPEPEPPAKKGGCRSQASTDFALLAGLFLVAFATMASLRLRKKQGK